MAEIAPRNFNEAQTLEALKNHVEPECWEGWTTGCSVQELSSLEFCVVQLEQAYGEMKNPIELEKMFRDCVQVYDDVGDYTREKEQLWNRAHPRQRCNDSHDFKRYWVNGLWVKFQRKIVDDPNYLEKDLDELKKAVLQVERTYKETGTGTYGSKDGIRRRQAVAQNGERRVNPEKRNGRRDTKPVQDKSNILCRYATCNKPDCPYKHPKAAPAQMNTYDENAFKKKCTRPHTRFVADHPSFACRDEKTECRGCKKRGHTVYLCPEKTCHNCQKKGHLQKVCGLSQTRIFQ